MASGFSRKAAAVEHSHASRILPAEAGSHTVLLAAPSYNARSHPDRIGDAMLHLLIAALAGVWLQTPAPASPVRSRPADIPFRVQMIDPGFSESVAVADFNKDGRRDILSAEYLVRGAVLDEAQGPRHSVQRQLYRQLQRPAGRRRRRRLYRHHPDCLFRAADCVAEEPGQGRRAVGRRPRSMPSARPSSRSSST